MTDSTGPHQGKFPLSSWKGDRFTKILTQRRATSPNDVMDASDDGTWYDAVSEEARARSNGQAFFYQLSPG